MICNLCKERINEKEDRYVHLEEFNCETIERNTWMHLKCFNKGMNRDLTKLERTAAAMLKKAGNIFNNLPQEFTEEKYTI